MAEISKPDYKIPKLKLPSGTPSSVARKTPVPPKYDIHSRNIQYANIIQQGLVDLGSAMDDAEMLRVRAEVNEEKYKLATHTTKLATLRDTNINTMSPKFLNGQKLEYDFMTDDVSGYKWGEEGSFMKYNLPDDISDKAKKQLQPLVDYENNKFVLESKSLFVTQLTNRSKKDLQINENKLLEGFNNNLNIALSEENLSKDFWSSNTFAEETANNFNNQLQKEVLYKTLSAPEAEVMNYNFKEKLAGVLFSRHLAMNPDEAIENYRNSLKIKDGKINSVYKVGGVSVDSNRISQLIDKFAYNKNVREKKEKESEFGLTFLDGAERDPIGFINKYGHIVKTKRKPIEEFPGGLDIDVEHYEIDEEILKQEQESNPLLTNSLLLKAINIAQKGKKNIEDTERKRSFDSLKLNLQGRLGTSDIYTRDVFVKKYYTWSNNRIWDPKKEYVRAWAKKYKIHETDVKNYFKRLALDLRFANNKHINGVKGNGISDNNFTTLFNKTIEYGRNELTYQKDTTEFSNIHPLDNNDRNQVLNEDGNKITYNQAYKLLSTDQKDKIDILKHNFKELKNEKDNLNENSIDHIKRVLKEKDKYYFDNNQYARREAKDYLTIRKIMEQRLKQLETFPLSTLLLDFGIDENNLSIKILKNETEEVRDPKIINKLIQKAENLGIAKNKIVDGKNKLLIPEWSKHAKLTKMFGTNFEDTKKEGE